MNVYVMYVLTGVGLCLKTKTDKGEKVFINICKSDQVCCKWMSCVHACMCTCVCDRVLVLQVPSPREISDEEVQQLVQSGDATKFRVPLSLGEPHTEKDNGQLVHT